MIIGLGIDVASIERIRKAVARHGQRFVARVLTAEEQQDIAGIADPSQNIAARLAAKEAAFKALGGPADVSWHHLVLRRAPHHPPRIELVGPAAVWAQKLGVTSTFVSLTHDAGVAAAVVILEKAP